MIEEAPQLHSVNVSVHVDPPGGGKMPGIYLCIADPSGHAMVLELSPALARNVADLLVCAAGVIEGGAPVIPTMRETVQ